jgi:hypothetical protein
MEIIRQADAFGLAESDPEPAPPPEKVAEWLKPATPWSGPTRVDAE